jgi:NDP-sugar pyrophosphorylase family protein
MKIVIPMSGVGQRFIDAGFKTPKPLIVIDGKPMIEHVVNLFPGEKNFVFICSQEHLNATNMRAVLESIVPEGKIIGIAPHKKGPVYAVSQAFDQMADDEEVIVNYCDFSKYWDYADFLRHTRERHADGAISAYKGFHPHMLGTTNYAFMRDSKQWMLEIQEKKPFTNNRMEEYASDGTYYFKNGAYVKKYFERLIQENIHINGEFYISLVYRLMAQDQLKISIYEIEHMLQWGTPRDVQDYQKWSNYFSRVMVPQKKNRLEPKSINLIPMAGKGSRFADVGYKDPKPLIPVSGKPMILQAAGCLPSAEKFIFVCLEDHLKRYPIREKLMQVYPQAKVVRLNQVTQGQACTCEVGLEGEDLESPLFIAASDNAMVWNADMYQELLDDPTVDCIAVSFRHDLSSERNPQMYGWIKVDNDNNILGVSVKKPISDHPFEDHAIVGAFYFRKARFFLEALKRLYQQNIRVNNEFYVDSCIQQIIEMGFKAKVFELDSYICWGTPQDLQVYQYWQSFFHKCAWHPYQMSEEISRSNPLHVEHFEQAHP